MSDAPSDSEAEDTSAVVQLPQHYVGRGNGKSQTSALKLVELGPRLRLELIKVEKGLGSGDVLYHAHISKTPEEAAVLKQRKQQEAALKEKRRSEQTANVERKRQAAEEKQQAKKQRQLEREQANMESLRGGPRQEESDSGSEGT
jgi:ribosome biogenesis protein SSF1/2